MNSTMTHGAFEDAALGVCDSSCIVAKKVELELPWTIDIQAIVANDGFEITKS